MSLDFMRQAIEARKVKVDLKPWMEGKKAELATIDTLPRMIDECIESIYYGCDLETTGLKKQIVQGRTIDKIVGYCLAPSNDVGYYVPVRHKKDKYNLPVTFVEKQFCRLAESSARAVFHNGGFDQEFLQYNGGKPQGLWDDPRKFEDTLILAGLVNARNRSRGLKGLSKKYLNREMIELRELYPKDHKGPLDFSELDPSNEAVIWYAAADGMNTRALFEILYKLVVEPEDGVPGQKLVYNLEKMCLPAIRWMTRCGVHTDQKVVCELIQLGQREYIENIFSTYDFLNEILQRNVEPGYIQLLREDGNPDDVDFNIKQQIDDFRTTARRDVMDVRDETGHYAKIKTSDPVTGSTKEYPGKYDILSRPQLGPLFEELQIPDITYTAKSKQVQTTQGEIIRLTEKHGKKYPFLPRIKRIGEVQKALSTYLFSLRNDSHDGVLYIRFNQLGTDTGRFTTPASKRPTEDWGTKFPLHGTPAPYDKSRPECLLRIREAITPRKGKVLAAIDFAGVELRIATNLSGEPLWLKEYFRCSSCGQGFDSGDGTQTPEPPPPYCPRCGSDKIGDLHTLTALAFYGKDAAEQPGFKQKRQKSKASNFALAYGGGPSALVRAAGIDENEAARFHRTFNMTYKTLASWWDSVKSFGRKNGFVVTAFGRRYPIPDIQLPVTVSSAGSYQQAELNKKFRSKAERNATNGPIQGCSADITKLSMALIYKEVKKRGWFDKVFMTITIHDELVFEIDKDILAEALECFQDTMTKNRTLLRLKWKVPLTTDCELGYNWTVPYDVKDFRDGRVRKDGVQVDEKGRETKKVWPEELVEIFGKKYGFFESKAVEQSKEEEPKEEAIQPLVYKLKNWGIGIAEKLAHVIVECRDKGNTPLEIVGPEGQKGLWEGATILVDPQIFEQETKKRGL